MSNYFPTSTREVGLFPLSNQPVAVSSLASIPATALLVTVRAFDRNPDRIITSKGLLWPSESVEVPRAELDSVTVHADNAGNSVELSYTQRMEYVKPELKK